MKTRAKSSRQSARSRSKAGRRATSPPRSATARVRRPRRKSVAIARSRLGAHAGEVYRRLLAQYPDAHCELDHRNAWELLVATILSAQCTDKRVNMVTPTLFARYPSPAALASADQRDVEEIIKSTGFFRNKTKSIIGMARAVTAEYGGNIPDSMEKLVTLPGVGRKTANVVLGNAFGRNEGVVVDTHVQRLSGRIGLTALTEPLKIEADLMRLFPADQWTMLAHLLIWHGRRVCDAKKPRCQDCVLANICPSSLA